MEVLRKNANKIAAVVGGIEGAEDVRLEQVAGFSQGEVITNREAIAAYKINVSDVKSFFNQFKQEGLTTLEAVRKGCDLRFTSVLMTTLTTILGLTPMFFATGSGAEIQAPLATVVMGGMASALLLVLIVLPGLYCLVEGRREAVEQPGL